MKYYAGIGSRSTPPHILEYMTKAAGHLEKMGYILRSGGAEGADKAFENGVKDFLNKEILRPKHSNSSAELLASTIHPMWSACNEYARGLHGRNCQIILGKNLDTPVEFVICWTLDGIQRGGTRTGLVLASQRGIPTFNLANPDEIEQFGALLKIL